MLDEQTPAETGNESTEAPSTDPAGSAGSSEAPPPRKRAPRKTAAKKAAAPEQPESTTGTGTGTDELAPAAKAPAKRTRKAPAKKAAAPSVAPTAATDAATGTGADTATDAGADSPPAKAPAKKAAAKKTTAKKSTAKKTAQQPPETAVGAEPTAEPTAESSAESTGGAAAESPGGAVPLFRAPDASEVKPAKTTAKKTTAKKASAKKAVPMPDGAAQQGEDAQTVASQQQSEGDPAATTTDASDGEGTDDGEGGEGGARRRRRRGGRRRRKGSGDSGDGNEAAQDDSSDDDDDDAEAAAGGQSQGQSGNRAGDDQDDAGEKGESSSTRRRRRRRRAGEGDDDSGADSENTVTRVRKPRNAEDEITGFSGSTRLEAKKQRRREGREAGRRRAPIISEAEFLARRESVDRKMVIRQRDDLTQIAVLEDKVLVEHYVARESQTSLIGNVYIGRVQNVLPSMEAAFIDIGKGRNAVLYAGEVNWEAFGAKEGSQRKIEQVLKSGQSVLVQVSKDPIGHKGARLTSQISLPGRFLVYVPDGNTSGISRKLPENERNRLKTLLKEIVPDTAGVIVRTAAEGASEDELTRDVERLKALWEDIEKKVEGGNAPQLLYGEPDLTLKVVRDLFTEDIAKLVVSGAEAWDMVEAYVKHVAPDLVDRLERHDDSNGDAFAAYRIDEQINKGLDRKVWLPSGGSLVIDRTEAMTVVDVNTGKFTGSGGNLEETVTKNNLEAAEEIVRQLRLRDIGGIIVIDFIDMVLESNRDLVLRRLIECLGRDRTRHQVAEVTSLGLVQMTRKRIGTGLLEAFSESCEACQGRGLILHQEPVDHKHKPAEEEPRRSRRSRGGKGKSGDDQSTESTSQPKPTDVRRPTPAEFAAMARAEQHHDTPGSAEETDGKAQPDPQSDQRPNRDGAERQAKAAAEPAEPADEATDQPTEQPTEQHQAAQPEPEAETEAEPAPAAQAATPPPPPAAPRIVTSTRRIGARRAAGPPPTSVTSATPEPVNGSAPGAAATDDAVDPTSPTVDTAESPAQPHVPVKKKGARKR